MKDHIRTEEIYITLEFTPLFFLKNSLSNIKTKALFLCHSVSGGIYVKNNQLVFHIKD